MVAENWHGDFILDGADRPSLVSGHASGYVTLNLRTGISHYELLISAGCARTFASRLLDAAQFSAPDKSIPDVGLQQKLVDALALAQEILSKHRLAGTDQNPKGVHDIVGHALILAGHSKLRGR